MKKMILILAASLLMVQDFYAQKIKGSDTVLPLTQKEAEAYLKQNASSSVVVTGGGSGVGIAALLDGTTDIAMSSRKIKFDEKAKLTEAGKSATEVIIAWDALAVITHPSNKLGQLTREQLEAIFTGKVKNWKEVGGDDLQIVVYSRETSSGTYEFFKESVLKNKNYMASVLSMPATGAIIQSISQTKGAIGYVGLAYLTPSVKALKVSYDKGVTFVGPSVAAALDKSYPVVRPLYYYFDKKLAATVKPFLDFVLSAQGQKIVSEVGYIPVK